MVRLCVGNTATPVSEMEAIVIKFPLTMTEEEYTSHTEMDEGMCLECGEIQGCCEPDAENYECESCEAEAVMGFEQMLVEGKIEFIDLEEEK